MCNFIMIMILLVTAYTGMWQQGRRQGRTHGYSKYFWQARVRTASAGVPAGPPRHALLVDADPGSISQHAPPEAAWDRQQIIE